MDGSVLFASHPPCHLADYRISFRSRTLALFAKSAIHNRHHVKVEVHRLSSVGIFTIRLRLRYRCENCGYISLWKVWLWTHVQRYRTVSFTQTRWVWTKPIDNKPSHWVLPPGHWRLKLKICRLYHANMCKFDAEIKSYKDGKTIRIYHHHYLPCTYNSKRCRYVCTCYYYDRADTFQ